MVDLTDLPDAPADEPFDVVKQHVEALDDMHVEIGSEHSDGFEYKASDVGLEWLQLVVEQNDAVRFDNPARAEAGHRYGMLLPTGR